MATLIFDDAFVSIGGVDLSDHVTQVKIDYKAELKDDAAMGDNTKKKKGGLLDWKIDIDFNQDFAASKVDATLFPLVGTAVALVVRPVKSTVVGTTNPNYTGTGILESYPPLGNSLGDLATTTASFAPAGDLTRATA